MAMEYGKIPGIDKPVSRLIQGMVMVSTDRLDESFALLDAVLATGVNTFDAAHGYGGGKVERAFGQWVHARNIREKVVLLDKGAHMNADRRRVTPFDIESDLHDSLARLKFDYIDLYVLHRDDPSQPVGPIVEVLNKYVARGTIRAFGGSNWTTDRLAEANEYADKHGLVGFTVSSPQFSLAEQVREPWAEAVTISGAAGKAQRDWYERTRLAVLPWSSLGWGIFFGDFRREDLADAEKVKNSPILQCYGTKENFDRLDRVRELAARRGASVAQVALAWVLRQPMNLFPLIGCRSREEIADCAAAVDLKLSAGELAWLNLQADRP